MKQRLLAIFMALVILGTCMLAMAEGSVEDSAESIEQELLQQIDAGEEAEAELLTQIDSEDEDPADPNMPETDGSDIYLNIPQYEGNSGKTVYAHFDVPEGTVLYNLTDNMNATAINEDSYATYEYLSADAAIEKLNEISDDGVILLSNGEEGTTAITVGNELTFDYMIADSEEEPQAG